MFSLKQFVWTCCSSNYQYQINADPRFANIFCRLQTFLWSIIYLVALQEIVSNYRQQLWYSSKYSSQIPNSVTALGSKIIRNLKIKMKINSNFILIFFLQSSSPQEVNLQMTSVFNLNVVVITELQSTSATCCIFISTHHSPTQSVAVLWHCF